MDQTSLFSRRDLYWRDAQKIIGALPVDQFQQAVILTHNIALNFSDDAQLQNILRRRRDYPFLDQHFWLLEDWSVPESYTRTAFEKNLLFAMLFNFMALETKAGIADPFHHFDASYAALQTTLTQRADFHFEQLFSESSPFWIHHQQAWIKTNASQTNLLDVTAQWAFSSLSIIAPALWADKESQLPQLLRMAEHLRLTFQIVENLSTLRRDLRDGRMTYPIQRALNAAGADGQKKPSADYVLGILIFTGTLEKICQENHARIESARVIAAELNLLSFQKFCNDADALMHQIRKQFSLKNQAEAESEPLRAFFVPAIDVLPNVIQKAEGYLLSDLTFHEAWEVQRFTFQNSPVVTGQAFPSCLILEILSEHGHEMSAPIDTIFELQKKYEFLYYDTPQNIVPDIDNVAFTLRLHRYSSQPETHKKILQTPLRWVRENQMTSGQIPVWLKRNDTQVQLSPLAVLYGANCATVEANLLLGLIDFDWDAYQDVITACAANWCERWLAIGLGATEHYTPLFSLWTSLELISKLLKKPISQKLQADLNTAAAQICERIRLEGVQPNLTPQNASFLILTCLCNSDWQSELPLNPDWLTVLYKHQRWDGSWEGEPLFVTPAGRGLETMWFKSRTVTSAFCYHALKTYQTMDDRRL